MGTRVADKTQKSAALEDHDGPRLCECNPTEHLDLFRSSYSASTSGSQLALHREEQAFPTCSSALSTASVGHSGPVRGVSTLFVPKENPHCQVPVTSVLQWGVLVEVVVSAGKYSHVST